MMNMLTTIAGFAGALTLTAGTPVFAAAPPVSVVSCDYSSQLGSGGQAIPATAPFESNNLHVTFVNDAPVAATGVRLAVQYGDRTQIVEDKGTFASGTPITQEIAPAVDALYRGPVSCSVLSVTYADGTSWQPV